MRPTLYFEDRNMETAPLGVKSSVPDLAGGLILQNNLEFYLDEDDEIYEGYGRCFNSYPYRQRSCYTRELRQGSVRTAVLENAHLKAVFLPEYGGRLWELLDKESGRELLYTNDILRFSNLAVCNAWFSGGVEWNIGVIGHSPFTTEPLFTAVMDDGGMPVLRMYEYERIRGVTYQMDFWLGEGDRFLNARMRVKNDTSEVIPMYWWSNIAVPEYDGGSIIVPASKAFTFRDGGVYKVDIPMVNGTDVTRYENIPASVDYFFDIPSEQPKYIANVDSSGFGLLQMSTARLRSRKLFAWGNKKGGDHWQQFLTKDAGKYVEIQAGLGKTQYGCLPMAPHTVWEWLERYGAVRLTEDENGGAFEELRDGLTRKIIEMPQFREMEAVLADTGMRARTEADRVVQTGSGYGELERLARSMGGERPMEPHLDFACGGEEEELWKTFMDAGRLETPDPERQPMLFVTGKYFFERLRKYVDEMGDRAGWYAHYQLGLLYFQEGDYEKAEQQLDASLADAENAWAYHGIASLYTVTGEKEKACGAMECGIHLRMHDLSYVKEGFRLQVMNGGYEMVIELWEELGESVRNEGRIRFYHIQALTGCGRYEEAYRLLMENGGLQVDDIREGEVSLAELWKTLRDRLGYEETAVPDRFDFTAI